MINDGVPALGGRSFQRDPIAVALRDVPSPRARDDGAALREIMSQLPDHLRA